MFADDRQYSHYGWTYEDLAGASHQKNFEDCWKIARGGQCRQENKPDDKVAANITGSISERPGEKAIIVQVCREDGIPVHGGGQLQV